MRIFCDRHLIENGFEIFKLFAFNLQFEAEKVDEFAFFQVSSNLY